MKAICNQKYANLKGIFDKGDKVEIEIIRYKEDTLIHDDVFAIRNTKVAKDYKKGQYIIVHASGENPERGIFKLYDKVVAPKGSYNGYRIKSKNGEYYSDASIRGILGYVALGDIFELCKS